MADFAAGSPDLTHPPPLPGLGTGYVETTHESLPVNIGGVGPVRPVNHLNWRYEKKNSNHFKIQILF